jgi:hypothetical protein
VTSKAKASSYFRFPRVTSLAVGEGLILTTITTKSTAPRSFLKIVQKSKGPRAPFTEPNQQKSVPKPLKKSTSTVSLSTSTTRVRI